MAKAGMTKWKSLDTLWMSKKRRRRIFYFLRKWSVWFQIKRTAEGTSKGFGFVRMSTLEEQDKVVQNTNHMLDGRRCDVKVPDPRVCHTDNPRFLQFILYLQIFMTNIFGIEQRTPIFMTGNAWKYIVLPPFFTYNLFSAYRWRGRIFF